MSPKNPIKFLSSYSKEDFDIFFGRNKEVSVLFDKVNSSKIILLYGISGTGKTSLIRCGLENKYGIDERVFVYVRKGQDILKSAKARIAENTNTLIHPEATLAEALESMYYDHFKPITVVFDQLEELFIDGDPDEIAKFRSAIAGILKSNLKVKFILSMREEYLANMDELEKEIEDLYDHRFRLEKMRKSKVIEVINKIAKILDSSYVQTDDDVIPNKILSNISGEDEKSDVELPYLQVYLDKIATSIGYPDNTKNLTEELVNEAGKLEDVLGDFLEEQITKITSRELNKRSINNLLKLFITSEGTKKPFTEKDISPQWTGSSVQLTETLKKLENARILKFENGVYELYHDSLAKKIAEKRTEEDLLFIKVKDFLRFSVLNESTLNWKQIKEVRQARKLASRSKDEKRFKLSMEENKLFRKSKRRMRLFKSLIYGGLFVVILGFLIWLNDFQIHSFEEHVQNAEYNAKEARYDKAITSYRRAKRAIHKDVFESRIGRFEINERIDFCLKRSKDSATYYSLKRSGDAQFKLGMNHYRGAFNDYYSAERLKYHPDDIESHIDDKVDDAINKYMELAQLEYKKGSKDIAFLLISEAYVLRDSEKVDSLINTWEVNAQQRNLDETISFLRKVEDDDFYTEEEKGRAGKLLIRYQAI